MHAYRKTLFSVVALATALSAHANTIDVTDTGAASASTCTLAQAIHAANLANNPGNQTPAGATTIAPLSNSATTTTGSCANASAGTNVLRLPSAASIDFSSDAPDNFWYGPNALPAIASTMVIEGNGATLNVVIGSSPRLRFFFIGADAASNATPGYNTPGPGVLTLRNLTLAGGRQNGGAGGRGGGGAGMGGAIYNQGSLRLESVTVRDNAATGGSAVTNSISAGGGMGQDGATFDGGGMGGALPQGTGDPGQTATTGPGAGGGTPNGLGGAGASGGASAGNGSGGGGSVGSCSVYYCGGGGGGFGGGPGGMGQLAQNPPVVSGGNFGSGGKRAGGGGVGGGGDGSSESNGGGGYGGGGGKCNTFGGGLGGVGGFGGGGGIGGTVGGYGAGKGSCGMGCYGGGGAGMGGGIFNHAGSVTLLNSTLTGNVATGGSSVVGGIGGSGGSGLGGAVFNLNGTVVVQFSTLASNRVAAGLTDGTFYGEVNGVARGGAIYSLAYNSASSTGSTSAALTLQNSIVAGSVGGSDLAIDQPSTVRDGNANLATASLVAAAGTNLVKVSESLNGAPSMPTFLTADPLLSPLADNGGPTQTMALQAGSPAIDVGNVCTSANLYVDQRGYERNAGAGPDLGAYETGAAPADVIFRSAFELPPGC